MDSISCTVFVRVMGYKSLLLAAHTATSLLVCRRGGGGEGGDGNGRHRRGTNTNTVGGGG